jgi:DNA invertase Pin-like site-specific DNA recombinase
MTRRKSVEFESNGKAAFYLRVSTEHQTESQLGLMAQSANVIRKMNELGLTPKDEHCDASNVDPPRPGFFVDESVSAFKYPLKVRMAGKRLMPALEKGDSLIVSRLDRAFRSVVDFIETSTKLTQAGIRLVVCQPQIDLGTAIGRAQAQMLAVLAEWESARRGERISSALKVKRESQNRVLRPSEPKTNNEPSEWRPSPPAMNGETSLSSGRVFISMRCSHRDSVESGLGLMVQLQIAKQFSDDMLERNSNLTWGGDFTDLAVSAASVELVKRPHGRKLDKELKSGDHVVFSTLDRGFRSVADFATTQKDWFARGIIMHFVGEGISTDNAFGRMMASLACCFAEMEAELCSDRAREARAQQLVQGKFVGGKPPVFWEQFCWVTKNYVQRRKLIVSRKKLIAFRLVKHLVHFRKMNVKNALDRCEELVAKHEKRLAIPRGGALKASKISIWFHKHRPDWPRDKAGTAFRPLTDDVYRNSYGKYEEAIDQWRKQVVAMREAELDKRGQPAPIRKESKRVEMV